jgi:hypothetical protein
MLLSMICLTLHYSPTFFHIGHDFRKSVIENEMCFDILYSVFSEAFLILRIQRDIVLSVRSSSCTVLGILVK